MRTKILTLLVLMSILLAACATATPATPAAPVKETVIVVETQVVEVEKTVPVEVEVLVTPTPGPNPEAVISGVEEGRDRLMDFLAHQPDQYIQTRLPFSKLPGVTVNRDDTRLLRMICKKLRARPPECQPFHFEDGHDYALGLFCWMRPFRRSEGCLLPQPVGSAGG
jgi:hypothetical protein